MCSFHFAPAPTVLEGRVIKRTIIRYNRLHRYSVDRYLAARTPNGGRFWLGMMERCTRVIEVFEPTRPRDKRNARP